MNGGWGSAFVCLAVVMLLSSSGAVDLGDCRHEAAVAADESLYNGNQDLVSDPGRPWVYSADTDGHLVHVLNVVTQTEMWNVSVGYSPWSIDISEDGLYMYVAVSTALAIVVVDIEARAVSKSVDLGFQPLSVRVGLSDRLYVTSGPLCGLMGWLAVVEESTGDVLENLSDYGTGVLEMSPDMTILLKTRPMTWPMPLEKFSCSGVKLQLLDEDNDDIDAGAVQMTVDWQNQTIYVGAYYTTIKVVSLATLDLLESMSAGAMVIGAALSADNTMVFCTTYGVEITLLAFDASDRTLVGRRTLAVLDEFIYPGAYRGVAAPPSAGSVIAYGEPVAFVDLSVPGVYPGWPAPDYSFYSFGDFHYEGNVSANIFPGLPPREITYGEIVLNGEALETSIALGTLTGVLPEPLAECGEQTVEATIGWDGGTASTSWKFYTSEQEHLQSVSPAPDEDLDHIPDNITMAFDLGYPERELLECTFTVNARPSGHTFDDGVLSIETSYLSQNLLLPGSNLVVVSLTFVFSAGGYYENITSVFQMSWNFNITDARAEPSLDGLAWHNLSTGVSLMLPADWDVSDSEDVDGEMLDTVAVGPVNGTVESVISLQSGTHPDLAGDDSAMDAFVDEFIDGLVGDGGDVSIVDNPSAMDLGDLRAVVFAVRCGGEFSAEKYAVIADQLTGQYWLLKMKAGLRCYFDLDPMFEGVISSFALSEPGEDDDGDPGGPIPVELAVAAGAAAAISAAAALVVWRRRKGPPKA